MGRELNHFASFLSQCPSTVCQALLFVACSADLCTAHSTVSIVQTMWSSLALRKLLWDHLDAVLLPIIYFVFTLICQSTFQNIETLLHLIKLSWDESLPHMGAPTMFLAWTSGIPPVPGVSGRCCPRIIPLCWTSSSGRSGKGLSLNTHTHTQSHTHTITILKRKDFTPEEYNIWNTWLIWQV